MEITRDVFRRPPGYICRVYADGFEVDVWRGEAIEEWLAHAISTRRIEQTLEATESLESVGMSVPGNPLDRAIMNGYIGRHRGKDFSVMTYDGLWSGVYVGKSTTCQSFDALTEELL